MLVYHNTFIAPVLSLNLQTGGTSHYFVIANNLFVGPDPLTQRFGFTIDWGAPNDGGTFDYNAYTPDGRFGYGWQAPVWYRVFQNLAEVQTALGWETHGMILTQACENKSPFESCLPAPASLAEQLAPPSAEDLVLAEGSNGIDAGLLLPNVNTESLRGEGPDLGAIERGCTNQPAYGPRRPGHTEDNQRFTCK
jgi:hypothetical protein